MAPYTYLNIHMYVHAYIRSMHKSALSSILDNEEIPEWILFGKYGNAAWILQGMLHGLF